MSLVLELDDMKADGEDQIQGKTNPAFISQDTELETEVFTPPLTYVEFYPRCLNATETDEVPVFEKLSKVIEQANHYLKSNQEFELLKCESSEKKVVQNQDGITVDFDTSIQHESSHGTNSFVRGLRLWLVPKEDKTSPNEQIGFITVFPDRQDCENTDFFSAIVGRLKQSGGTSLDFAPISSTIEKLNRQLQMRPLPGKILNIETITNRFCEEFSAESLDAESCFWQEYGSRMRFTVFAIRIYYIIGEHAFETIGFKDFPPHKIEPAGGSSYMSQGKFAPFHKSLKKAATWLKEQKNIRVVNIQTVNVKNEAMSTVGRPVKFNSEVCGYTEQSTGENHIVRVFRMFYVTLPKSEGAGDSYVNTDMQCRLFVPERIGGTGKSYEPFSKTLQKVIQWLHRSGNQVFNIETLSFMINPDSYGTGVTEDKADMLLFRNHGRYNVTAVRIYFPGPIKEAPPEVTSEEEEAYWCSIQ